MHSFLHPEADLVSNCGLIRSKTVSLKDIVHFIDEENIVTLVDFDCGITFNLEAPTKVRQINQKRKNISLSCENPKCITNKNQHNYSFDEEQTSNIFQNPYNI